MSCFLGTQTEVEKQDVKEQAGCSKCDVRRHSTPRKRLISELSDIEEVVDKNEEKDPDYDPANDPDLSHIRYSCNQV